MKSFFELCRRPLRRRGRFDKAFLLFGSVARGETREDSDVDLLVEFSQPVGMFQFIEIQQWLESLLGCRVDLGTPRSLKSALKEKVLREAIRVAYDNETGSIDQPY